MLVVELRGPGCSVLYGADADGEPLRAVEHLLLRMFGEALRPQGLRVRCEGFRERREAALGARARQLAADVRESGGGRRARADERLRATAGACGVAGRAGRAHAQRGRGQRSAGADRSRGRGSGAGRTRRGAPRLGSRQARDETAASPHAAALEALGISGSRARQAVSLPGRAWPLERAREPDRRRRSSEERVRLLVGDVLPAACVPVAGGLIDVGSGNGSPGLVFALLREDLEVTLLEPRQKRWAFLREAVRLAGPARRVAVERCRHDGYRGRPGGHGDAAGAGAAPRGAWHRSSLPRARSWCSGGARERRVPSWRSARLPGVSRGGWLFRRPSVSRGTPSAIAARDARPRCST